MRAVAAALLLALVAACAAGPAPRDRFYQIEPAAPQRLAKPVLDGTVVVDRPRTDALTRERLILYRESPGDPEVQRHSYHQWADSPPVLVQSALVGYLRAAGIAERVVTPELRVPADYAITGRIVKLERVLGSSPPGVLVEVELNLTNARFDRLLMQRSYREERPAADDTAAQAAAATSEALGAIFSQFVADLSGVSGA